MYEAVIKERSVSTLARSPLHNTVAYFTTCLNNICLTSSTLKRPISAMNKYLYHSALAVRAHRRSHHRDGTLHTECTGCVILQRFVVPLGSLHKHRVPVYPRIGCLLKVQQLHITAAMLKRQSHDFPLFHLKISAQVRTPSFAVRRRR